MATRIPRGQDDLVAEPRSIELRDYALVVRRRWVIVLLAAVLGAALGVAYGVHKGPVYAATSQVVVNPATQGPLNPPAAPNLQVNMVTEQAVAESAPVAVLAAKLMHSALSGAVAQGKLASDLAVTVPVLSNVLQITWQAGTPKAAQQGANAFANAYLTYRHDILFAQITRLGATLSSQVTALQHQIKSVSARLNRTLTGTSQYQSLNATLTELNGQLTKSNGTLASLPTYDVSGGKVIAAGLPLSPSGLGRSTTALLGALLGLLAGVVAAFVRDAFDDRLRDPAVLERKLGAPTLAILPGIRGARGGVVATFTGPDGTADPFRALRTTLTSVTAGRDVCSIVVVGIDGSVSSSQVAAELSVALAESGRRTLLIAADIRGSSLPQIFDLPNASGLTDVLVGQADPEALMQYPKYAGGVGLSPGAARKLALITSGPPLAQPLSVLDSVAMARFLKSLRHDYDFVVLDSPPADAAADFLAIARLADGVVAVASEARSGGRAAEDLRRRLDRIGGYLAGGIFIARSRALGGRRADPAGAELIRGAAAAKQADGHEADRAGLAKPGERPAQRSSPAQPDAVPDGPQRIASIARRPS
ncbi:MAG: Wzz/FepE/Etk N-terminal domain-containing protein [Streptosporangiaceae bacterium]